MLPQSVLALSGPKHPGSHTWKYFQNLPTTSSLVHRTPSYRLLTVACRLQASTRFDQPSLLSSFISTLTHSTQFPLRPPDNPMLKLKLATLSAFLLITSSLRYDGWFSVALGGVNAAATCGAGQLCPASAPCCSGRCRFHQLSSVGIKVLRREISLLLLSAGVSRVWVLWDVSTSSPEG